MSQQINRKLMSPLRRWNEPKVCEPELCSSFLGQALTCRSFSKYAVEPSLCEESLSYYQKRPSLVLLYLQFPTALKLWKYFKPPEKILKRIKNSIFRQQMTTTKFYLSWSTLRKKEKIFFNLTLHVKIGQLNFSAVIYGWVRNL